MAETPEQIQSEIAALEAKQQEEAAQLAALKDEEAALAANDAAKPVVEPIVETAPEPLVEAPAVEVAAIPELSIAAPVVKPTAPVHSKAQTVPARWALQPLAR